MEQQINYETIEVIEGRVKVALEYIGEGLIGDYDPTESEDVPLLRFTVYYAPIGGADRDSRVRENLIEDGHYNTFDWTPCVDASYCTSIDARAPHEDQLRAATHILMEVLDDVTASRPIKKICERLSWISC